LLRPTIFAFVDQALLSALSFALSLALIRYAPPAEYGLYAQLLNLQSLFSVVHAGLFVSGLLAIHPSLNTDSRPTFTGRLARSDACFGIASAPVIAAVTYVGALSLRSPISAAFAAASALAVVGLWWREFSRAAYFADLHADRVLALDLFYAMAVALVLALLTQFIAVSAASVVLATGVAGVAAGGFALIRFAGRSPVTVGVPSLRQAWRHGQWDTYGSVVTWLQSQSYVFFAAAAGGLAMAGAVSAARLMGMPLALAWAGGANVLRVSIAKALAADDVAKAANVVRHALLLVIVVSALYVLFITAAFPAVDRYLYHYKFVGLGTHVSWWLAYFVLTGISTTGAAVMRGALRMAALFRCYVIACAVTLAALGLASLLQQSMSVVTALAAGEVTLSTLIWIDLRRFRIVLSERIAAAGYPGPIEADAVVRCRVCTPPRS